MALACSSPQPERVGNLPISSLKHLARRAVIHVLQETLTLTSAKLTDAFARGQDSGFQREVTPRQAGGYPAGLDEEGRAPSSAELDEGGRRLYITGSGAAHPGL